MTTTTSGTTTGTATTTPTTTSTGAPAGVPGPDHRAGRRLRALCVVAGGLLFAAGNLAHPLEHSDAAELSPLWGPAHVTFAAGGLLVAAGIGSVSALLRSSRVAQVGTGLVWLAMVLMSPSAFLETFVAPHVGHDTSHTIESAAIGVTALTALSLFVGHVLLAVGGLRARALPRPVAAALLAGVAVLVAGPGLPGPDGVAVITGTVLLGLGLAGVGLRAGTARATEQR
ncbi:hypothetical protein NUM3379_39450 [Kineococcus sp. NUM-3379]